MLSLGAEPVLAPPISLLLGALLVDETGAALGAKGTDVQTH